MHRWASVLAWVLVAVHWNLAGQADRHGGKFEGLPLLPTIALADVAGVVGLVVYSYLVWRQDRDAITSPPT